MKNQTKKQFFIISALLIISSLGARLSFAWGSHTYFFSLLAIILPMVGVLCKTKRSTGIVGGYFAFKALLGAFPLTFGLPSLCAAANWSTYGSKTKFTELKKFLLNIVLPLVCMLIFVLHPVGRAAWMYSLYWLIPIVLYLVELFLSFYERKSGILSSPRGVSKGLIPIVLYLLKNKSIFTVSLSSTFIAHAVGSIFWLFLMPMGPERWIALIPIVAVERLLFAVAGVGVYRVIQKALTFSWCRSAQISPITNQ